MSFLVFTEYFQQQIWGFLRLKWPLKCPDCFVQGSVWCWDSLSGHSEQRKLPFSLGPSWDLRSQQHVLRPRAVGNWHCRVGQITQQLSLWLLAQAGFSSVQNYTGIPRGIITNHPIKLNHVNLINVMTMKTQINHGRPHFCSSPKYAARHSNCIFLSLWFTASLD